MRDPSLRLSSSASCLVWTVEESSEAKWQNIFFVHDIQDRSMNAFAVAAAGRTVAKVDAEV